MRYLVFMFALCLLVISAQAGTFRDNFEDGNLDGWGAILDYDGGISEWKIENGVLTCRRPKIESSLLLFGKREWKNYSIECDARMVQVLTNFRSLGVDLRVQDASNCVWCGIGGWNGANKAFIEVWFNDKPFANTFEAFNLEENRWYHLRGIANDDNFEFYVDGKILGSLSDSHFKTGYVDLNANGCLAHFDNVVITGDDVPDKPNTVNSKHKLATSWGQMKSR